MWPLILYKMKLNMISTHYNYLLLYYDSDYYYYLQNYYHHYDDECDYQC